MPDDERPTVALGHDHPYDAELAVFGADMDALARLAEAGGGALLDGSGTEGPAALIEAPEEERVMRSLRTPLLAAALILYLLSLLFLRLPDHSVGATVTRPERKRRRWGSRARSMHPDAPSDNKTKEAA